MKMNTDNLNRWLTLSANLAVLASIVFLALEIQQNTEMTRAQITQSRAETSIALAEMLFNSEHIPPILEKARNGEELNYQEYVRYSGWLRATLRNLDNNIQQSKRGLLGEHIPRASAGAIRGVILANPTAREYWRNSKDTFSDEFVVFVDAIIEEVDRASGGQ
jgi:hypothetical protein